MSGDAEQENRRLGLGRQVWDEGFEIMLLACTCDLPDDLRLPLQDAMTWSTGTL